MCATLPGRRAPPAGETLETARGKEPTMSHPNEDLVRQFYKAQAARDRAAVLDTLSDDIVWHAAPGTPMEGTFRGKEEVGELFDRIQEMTGGTFTLEAHDVLANDEHAIGLARARGQRDGKTLDQPVVHVFHVTGGKLAEFWPHPLESAKFMEFFA
jgi:uncharacterized protein